MRVKKQLVALLIGAAVTACSEAESNNAPGPGGGGPPGLPVEVAVARTDTVVDAITSTGQIEAINSIQLRPEVDGRLVEFLVREGAVVAKGTPLFKVDDAELKAQVARLEADRDLAEQALRRTRELLKQNASSEADLEQAEASARSSRAQLDLQQLRLERTVVRAPFAGVVGERSVSVGDYVNNATPLVTLQTVDPQRAVFQVPERYAQRLSLGQPVSFRVAALPNAEFSGLVDFVDPLVRLPARTITVKAQVPNRNGSLKAGMFIEASLATDTRPNAVVVPEDAILPLEGATYVWLIQEEKAARRPVELGVRMPGYVEIIQGLSAGDQVVVGGLERLSEGVPVMATVVDR